MTGAAWPGKNEIRTVDAGKGCSNAELRSTRCAAQTSMPKRTYQWAYAARGQFRLPDDIAVTDAVESKRNFNAIGSCIKRNIYIKYTIAISAIRFLKAASSIRSGSMEQFSRAAAAFEGTHDFKAVRSVGTETKTTVRTVYWCRAEKEGDIITVSICADGFLYNMCRAMVGTMVYASYGKLRPGYPRAS